MSNKKKKGRQPFPQLGKAEQGCRSPRTELQFALDPCLHAAAARQMDRQPPLEHGWALVRLWGWCDSKREAMCPSLLRGQGGKGRTGGFRALWCSAKYLLPPLQVGHRSPAGLSWHTLQRYPVDMSACLICSIFPGIPSLKMQSVGLPLYPDRGLRYH